MGIKKRTNFIFFGTIFIILLAFFCIYGRYLWKPIYYKVIGRRTISDVINELEPSVSKKLSVKFEMANINYPPTKITLLAFKKEKKLETWAFEDNKWKYICSYDILAASGKEGPKLREGDRQVPEGIYKIIGLNPNSSFHLSMKINYPNEFDKQKAKLQERSNLGGDIFLHGKAASVGCIAIGDNPIEELFFLVNIVGKENVEVIIAPNDLRVEKPIISENNNLPWIYELYNLIEKKLKKIQK